jgi:hypothetical protein
MSKPIEVRLPKQRLFFIEEEFRKLLYSNPEVWKNAIRRGKGINLHTEIDYT